jgi:hypothetical protein
MKPGDKVILREGVQGWLLRAGEQGFILDHADPSPTGATSWLVVFDRTNWTHGVFREEDLDRVLPPTSWAKLGLPEIDD